MMNRSLLDPDLVDLDLVYLDLVGPDLADAKTHADGLRQSTTGFAMLLLQFAAARAEIGQFAQRGRETPQMAARRYEAAAPRGQERKARLA